MTSGIIFVIIPYCIIYCIRNFLLYVPIRKVLLNFLEYQLFLTLTVLTVTILFIVNLFLIVLDIFLIHQVLLIILAITPVSAIAQFYLFFFTVSITYRIYYLSLQYSYWVGFFYQLPISGPSISVVIRSAAPPSYFYRHTVSYQVVLSSVYMR